MSRNYRNYTDQQVVDGAKEVKSIAGLLRYLNLKPVGGNYYTIKRVLQKLNVDTTHWTGQAWNKDQQLKDWSEYTKSTTFKKHLIKTKGVKCERCLNTHWQNELIPLECHHIDGDRTNNQYSNLELLCPNCHALTDNWKNKK